MSCICARVFSKPIMLLLTAVLINREELKTLRDQARDRKEQSREQLLSLRPPLTQTFVV